MRRLIKAELYKLIHDRSFFILSALSILLGSVIMLGKEQLSGYESIFASLYNVPLMMLLTSVFGALYIGRDLAERTLYHAICSGYKRNYVFFSKAIVFIIGSNIILLAQPILCVLLNTFINGWGVNTFLSDFGYIAGIFGITIILNSAMCGVSLITAFACKDVGKTLAIPASIYFLVIFLLNSSNAETIARFVPLGQLRLLLEQSSSLALALFVGVLYFTIMYIIANIIFNVSELK